MDFVNALVRDLAFVFYRRICFRAYYYLVGVVVDVLFLISPPSLPPFLIFLFNSFLILFSLLIFPQLSFLDEIVELFDSWSTVRIGKGKLQTVSLSVGRLHIFPPIFLPPPITAEGK